jgi:hypothetical protein
MQVQDAWLARANCIVQLVEGLGSAGGTSECSQQSHGMRGQPWGCHAVARMAGNAGHGRSSTLLKFALLHVTCISDVANNVGCWWCCCCLVVQVLHFRRLLSPQPVSAGVTRQVAAAVEGLLL